MVKNANKAVPAAYIVPSMDVVEMGMANSILVSSKENGTEIYDEEEWPLWS